MQYLLQILHLSCQVQRLVTKPLRNRMAEQMNVFFCLLFKKCITKQLLDEVEHDIMNYQNLVSILSAEADNTDLGFDNS